jgi:hypothetical protein
LAGNLRRSLLVTALAACLLAAAGASSAAAAGWQLQAHVEGEQFRPNLPLLGVSCPSASLCVVVGELDAIVSSTNPTGGASAWHEARPTGEATTDCHEHWSPPCQDPKARAIRSVSCPSVRLCVAVTGEGYLYSTTDPTGPAEAWQTADIDGTGRDTHLLGVSCPTVTLCVAVSGERYTAGKVLTSTDPTGGAGAWHVTQLDESLDLRGVSCGTPTLCVAVAQQGRLLVSTDPTGGPSSWTEVGTPGGPGDLQGVSCATTVLCVSGNAGGNLLTSTNPTSVPSWQEADGGVSVQVTGVSCLPTRQCLAVDNNGDVLASDDPTAGAGSWTITKLLAFVQTPSESEAPLNGLFGVSCASSSFCAVAGADGQIFTSADPFGATGGPAANGKGQGKRRGGPLRPRVRIVRAHTGFRVRNRHLKSHVYFRFHSVGRARSFLCRRESGPFLPCRSPVRYRAGVGHHVFSVRAVGTTGLKGPIVTRRFRIDVNTAFSGPHR